VLVFVEPVLVVDIVVVVGLLQQDEFRLGNRRLVLVVAVIVEQGE